MGYISQNEGQESNLSVEKKKGPSPLQRIRRRIVPTSVYLHWGEDLKELRKIVGWTQTQAYERIIGGLGPVRWAQWEGKKKNHRPGKQSARLILNWATNYNAETRAWALKMYQKEAAAKMKDELGPDLSKDFSAVLGDDWKMIGE